MTEPIVQIREALKRHAGNGAAFELAVPALDLYAGQVAVVAGRSGCGKTTLLDVLGCISGFTACGHFVMNLRNRTYNLASRSELARGRVRRYALGYVLQQGGLLPFLTARENILLPLKMSDRKMETEALESLAGNLGICDQLDKYPEALSIGQRQRVSIARALAPQPALLLADEPTGALDPLTAMEVKELLLKEVRRAGSAAIIVTHDVKLFAAEADLLLGFRLERTQGGTRSTLAPLDHLKGDPMP